MSSQLPKSAQRVQDALIARGLSISVVEFPDSTRTAQEAADAIGCTVEQIVKSLLFRRKTTGRPVMALASGANRVDEKALKALLGENVERADPEFVLAHTGYAIGGVPPVGLAEPIETFMDEDLMRYGVVWAAAGTPHAVFSLTPSILAELTGGKWANIKQSGR